MSLEGKVGAEWSFPIDESKVRDFARAVFQDDPTRVPPTFPAYGIYAYERPGLLAEAGLDWTLVLHGEQEYEYLSPMHVGQRLVCRSRITADYRKEGRRGGTMRFIVQETEMRDADTGELVVRARSTMIETGRTL